MIVEWSRPPSILPISVRDVWVICLHKYMAICLGRAISLLLDCALNRLMAYSRLTHVNITIETAKEQLESIINPDSHKTVTPELIIEIVAEHFQKTPDQLLSKSRSSDIARPRQIAMYLLDNFIIQFEIIQFFFFT